MSLASGTGLGPNGGEYSGFFLGGKAGVPTPTGVCPLVCGSQAQHTGAGRRDSLGLCVQSPGAHSVACRGPHCLLLHVSPSRAAFPAICPSTSAHTSLPAVPTAWLPACPTRRWTVPKGCEHNHCHGAAPEAPRAVRTPGKLSSSSPQSSRGSRGGLRRLRPRPSNS